MNTKTRTYPKALQLFHFDNSFARKLPNFYVACQAARAPDAQLHLFNAALAESLGLSVHDFSSPYGVAVLAGNAVAVGSEPLAQAYAGYQFGHFSPQLGDGRALLLGEIIDRRGQRRDIALKGSGRTPFSRNGDGLYALGPALREYLMSEAMYALGIASTRTLAVISSGQLLRREREVPGAVLTRVATSHIRIGTFEFFAARKQLGELKQLADYVITRHYAELIGHKTPYLALLAAYSERQAALIANWLRVGFIHGVMNTDNMSITPETLDYGPCAFLEHYDPAATFSSIDTQGRYAYGQQAQIAQWNLARFAEALLPLIDDERERAIELANTAIAAFAAHFQSHWQIVLRHKLGLDAQGELAADQGLAEDYLALLKVGQIDFTLAFRALFKAAEGDVTSVQRLFSPEDSTFTHWLKAWQTRQSTRSPALLNTMRLANPCYIPRNHLVEDALSKALEEKDMSAYHALLGVLQDPYRERPDDALYRTPAPREFTQRYRTFCGT